MLRRCTRAVAATVAAGVPSYGGFSEVSFAERFHNEAGFGLQMEFLTPTQGFTLGRYE